jgi:hypothetical protein
LFTICITYIYIDFFIWNIKTLIFFNFSGLTRVDPGWPMKPGTRPLGQVNSRVGFNNYAIWFPKDKLPYHSKKLSVITFFVFHIEFEEVPFFFFFHSLSLSLLIFFLLFFQILSLYLRGFEFIFINYFNLFLWDYHNLK